MQLSTIVYVVGLVCSDELLASGAAHGRLSPTVSLGLVVYVARRVVCCVHSEVPKSAICRRMRVKSEQAIDRPIERVERRKL